MSRSALAIQDAARTGVVPTATVIPTDGISFVNDGKTILVLKNTHVSDSINVTVKTGATLGGLAIADRVIAVAAGVTKIAGPWPTNPYNTSDGKIEVDASVADQVECSPMRVTPVN